MAMSCTNNDYEMERAKIMLENRRKMEEMGLLRQKSIMESFAPCKRVDGLHKAKIQPRQPSLNRRDKYVPIRRSTRLQGVKLEEGVFRELSDEEEGNHRGSGLLDLMDRSARCAQNNDGAGESEAQAEIQQIRCSSAGRGSLYDSAVGITCHFCRQKKLCGEPDCTRCQTRNSELECIGKSDCSRCHAATGKFCRACLLIRYGGNLDEVREQMAAGTWLCPHCYEDENPDEGWICNSSICMTRRGLKPTGIAIYDALEQGFKSVGHLLQSQLIKRGGIASMRAAGAAPSPGACGSCEEGAPRPTGVSSQESGPTVATDAAEPGPRVSSRRVAGRPPKAPSPADAAPSTSDPAAAGTQPAPGEAVAGSPQPITAELVISTTRPRGRPSKPVAPSSAAGGAGSALLPAGGRVCKKASSASPSASPCMSHQRATRATKTSS